MTVVVRDCPVVTSRQRLEADIRGKVIEIRFHRSLSVVVVDFAICKLHVPYGKIKYVRVAAALARRGLRKIVLPLAIHLQMHYRMLDQ